ncbi:MAG TPA: RecX family transcriptional regulator, partial [Alcanivorax sp.]|nr:RecX family transcriptional regulator [Alcanivorax sp.]
ADRKEKARQLRFLQSRGFDAEQSFNALDLAGEEDLD